MGSFDRKRLGDILVDAGIITPDQLTEALESQKTAGTRLGQELVRLKYATGEQIAAALSAQLGIPYVRLSDYTITEELVKLIPDKVARKHKIIPIEKTDDKLTVAVADPLDVAALDNISIMLGFYVEPVIAPENEIIAAQDQHYASLESMENLIQNMSEDDLATVDDTPGSDLAVDASKGAAEDAPVIKYVNAVILNALKDRASDVHIEPFEKIMQIRERIDGVLQAVPSPPRNLWSGIPSRIKVMANLNIAETRLPQDGRIRMKLGGGREIDMRVSTLPTMHGESVVLRLLDRGAIMLAINQLGMQKAVEEAFRKHLDAPNGIVLITGPTGCGKTTTLYAGILEINSTDDKIITVEDPVEYEVAGLVQCQVVEKIGMTFAAALRSILRQDPDIILIGEIRDVETAQIAIQSALTGHLVLSTTHTNDAAGAVTRLIDMGVEPFLLTSTIQAICAQRLVRTICPECKEPYTPDPDDLRKLGKTAAAAGVSFFHGKGCPNCAKTGYRGRTGIYELLPMTDAVMDLVVNKMPANIIFNKAVEEGMLTMAEDGWQKICAGITTVEEVLRVAPAGIASVPDQRSGGAPGAAPAAGPPAAGEEAPRG